MTTLIEAMAEAARRCQSGFGSVAESGTTTSLVDAALLDSGAQQDAYAGGWVYRPEANPNDRMRALPQQGSFNTQSGGLAPIRPWNIAPAEGEPYQLYAVYPPREQPGQTESWNRLVNRALINMWEIADFPVGSGIGSPRSRWFPVLRAEVVLLAAIVIDGGSDATITPPTGWFTAMPPVNLSTTLQLALFTHRVRLNDPINWTFAFDGMRIATGGIVAYLDPNPTAPIDVYASTTVTADDQITAPQVTTSQQNETVLRIVAGNVPLTWDPQGHDLQRRLDATLYYPDSNQGLAVFDATMPTAAATDTNQFTATQSADQIAITLAWARRDPSHRAVFAGQSVAWTDAAGGSSIVLSRPVNVPNDEWLPGIADTRKAFVRRYTALEGGQFMGQPYDYDLNVRGSWWTLHEDNGNRYLEVAPWWQWKHGDVVMLEVQRPYKPLVTDLDETECHFEALVLRTRYEFYSALNSASATRGQYNVELAQALADWQREYSSIKPSQAVIGA